MTIEVSAIEVADGRRWERDAEGQWWVICSLPDGVVTRDPVPEFAMRGNFIAWSSEARRMTDEERFAETAEVVKRVCAAFPSLVLGEAIQMVGQLVDAGLELHVAGEDSDG